MDTHEPLSKLGTPTGYEHGSIKSYALGFVLSLILTLISYFVVEDHLLDYVGTVATISVCAFFQAVVQLVLFLHLGGESKPRWKFLTFLFMALVVGVIVLGSLWIMYNLNYRLM